MRKNVAICGDFNKNIPLMIARYKVPFHKFDEDYQIQTIKRNRKYYKKFYGK